MSYGLIPLYLSFFHADARTFLLVACFLGFGMPVAIIWFAENHFEKTLRVYLAFSWLTNLGYLLVSSGGVDVIAVEFFIILSNIMLITLLINWKAGLIATVVSISLGIADVLVLENYAPVYLQGFSKIEFVISYFSMFVILVGSLLFFSNSLYKAFDERKKEQALRHAREAQLEQANIRLNHSLEQLEEAHQKITQYAFSNSHHLRAPLAKVMGIANLLQHSTPEEARDLLSLLNMSAQDLDKVIREMNVLLEEDFHQ
jgi:signal transduction histidine kinase